MARLVQEYRSGATVYDLADRFGVHRATVSQHLQRQGVQRRRCGLDDEHATMAVRLYQQGQSLAQIGERLSVDPGTVRAALLARDVRTRDPQGRER